ncbi:MAG: hypothetical protein QOG17_3256 [Gammaproteobacteria bacterium]|nr:hypothetical protein [Gammaproteobacteria bacterium]
MSKNTYPLRFSTSVKKAAAELAANDGYRSAIWREDLAWPEGPPCAGNIGPRRRRVFSDFSARAGGSLCNSWKPVDVR